ncbi:hypothetical protein HPB49_013993 [Dermacentor silvarum]|uniref:Uncharacterized protein n=1 Tax=Dermacentor silvarum TaxID=543639 RepID=A0ACB8CLJ0_DERSI|nr:hypothetical protein HPB49_013993 [Dermacentor silvarum]
MHHILYGCGHTVGPGVTSPPCAQLVTKGGQLVGRTVIVDGVTLSCFLGIPFAHSTAGDRRFTAPLPLAETGDKCAVREYLEPRPPCAQWSNGSVVGSEDCLHVNVWTPEATVGDNVHGGGRAMVVAVSGNWFETGSNDDPDWPKLAAKGHLKTLCMLLFHMKPQFFLKRVPRPGCGATKNATPPVARKKRRGRGGAQPPARRAGLSAPVVRGRRGWGRGQLLTSRAQCSGRATTRKASAPIRSSWCWLAADRALTCSPAVARKLPNDTALRAFYHGIVYGSLLPFDPAVPYQHLASALNCSDTNKSMSAWVSCFRATPVDDLLQAAHNSSQRPLQFAPQFTLSSLQAPPATTPPTVIAGADAADDKALFMERILPLAQHDGNASTMGALVDYMLDVFNVPSFEKFVIKGRFKVHSVDEIAEGLSMWVSTCATLKVATAVDVGYHYRFDSAVASGQLRPPLGIDQVAQFAANGNMSKTRVVGENDHEDLVNYDSQCKII